MNAGRVELLTRLPIASIEKVNNEALATGDVALHVDAAHALSRKSQMQSPEIENCGRLFEHIEAPSPKNGGRFITRYTGDPMVWMQPFTQAGAGGKFNRAAGVVRRETVPLREGEHLQIVARDGSVKKI